MVISTEVKQFNLGQTATKPTPKHQLLTTALRQMVREMSPGERFPTQAELMRRFGVSDRTVLRSLDDLRRAGDLVRRQGSGTFIAEKATVKSPPEAVHQQRQVIVALSEGLKRTGYFEECCEEFGRLSKQAGLMFVFQTSHGPGGTIDTERVETNDTLGFLLFGYRHAVAAKKLIERGYRGLIIGAPNAGEVPDVPCVYPDGAAGAYAAAQHLIDLGHRRLAYWGADDGLRETTRWAGHRRAIEVALRNGYSVHDEVIDYKTAVMWRDDPSLVKRYFQRPESPTGLLTWNDDNATLLVSILNRAGLSVPGDISVVGFDNLLSGRNNYPAITTVDTHAQRIAELALELLMSDMPLGTREVVIVPELMVRESCAVKRD